MTLRRIYDIYRIQTAIEFDSYERAEELITAYVDAEILAMREA